MKKYITLILAAALLLAASCGVQPGTDVTDTAPPGTSSEGTGHPTTPGQPVSSVFSLACEPGSASFGDPFRDVSAVNACLYPLMFDTLYRLDGGFTAVPWLVSSMEQNGLEYRFEIKQGVYFHDGTELTAHDAEWSLLRAAESEIYGVRLDAVETVEAVARHTLVVTLSSPRGALTSLLDIPIAKASGSGLVGSGRYIPDLGGETPLLSLNPSWHAMSDDGAPLQFILLTEVSDTDSLLRAYSAGGIDCLPYDRLNADGIGFYSDADIYYALTTDLIYLSFNTRRGPFGSAGVRLAISRLIDREGLCAETFFGSAHPAYGVFPYGSAFYNEELAEKYAVSEQDAEELFAVEGYTRGWSKRLLGTDGKQLTVEILVNSGNRTKTAAAEKIAADLTAFGIAAEVNPVPFEDYKTALLAGRYDIALCETAVTADFNYSPLLASGGALNTGTFSDPDLNALLTSFASTAHASAQLIAEQLQNSAAALAPIVPIGYKKLAVPVNRKYGLTGVTVTAADPFYNITEWTAGS